MHTMKYELHFMYNFYYLFVTFFPYTTVFDHLHVDMHPIPFNLIGNVARVLSRSDEIGACVRLSCSISTRINKYPHIPCS